MPENSNSRHGSWHSLTGKQKLFTAFVASVLTTGLLVTVTTLGLFAASFFISVARIVWLLCFRTGSIIFICLFAEPYIRTFSRGGWMVFANNIIYFWLVTISVATAASKAFPSPALWIILGAMLAMFAVDASLRLGYVKATAFFLKHWRLKTPMNS